MTDTSEQIAPMMAPSARLPWRMRFHAWWNGYELTIRPKGSDAAGGDAPEAASAADVGDAGEAGSPVLQDETLTSETWPPERLDVAQWIWGEGFVSPGSAIHILDLVKSLDLKDSWELLFLGAGLGGPVKFLIESSGVRAKIWEPNPELAAAVGEDIKLYDPDKPGTDSKPFDYIFAKEAFFAIANKERLFDALVERLSKRGQMLFTDYVLSGQGLEDAEIAAWLKSEPVGRHPVTLDDHVKAVEARNLKVRGTRDITDTHRQLIQRGFEYLSERLAREKPDPRYMPLLRQELGLWTHRVQAMDAGVLKVFCVHAGR